MTSSVSIGTGGHRISIPTIAAVTAPTWRKSACYDRLEQTLNQQKALHSIPEIITTLGDVLPIDVTAATERAAATRDTVIGAATRVSNLEPLGFLDTGGDPIEVEHADKDKRPEGIAFVRVLCRIQGSRIHSMVSQPDLELEFTLALPQSRRDSATGAIENLFKSSSLASTNTSTPSKQSRLFKSKRSNQSSSTFTTSWYGQADFLDSQKAFNDEFGTAQPPLLHTDPTLGDASEVISKLQTYANACQFDVAMKLCRYDYVGSSNSIDSTLAVQEVCKEISLIQQEYREKNGKKNIRCPDEMFTMYLELTPSLPEDTTLWTIRLCSSYFNALMNDLKDRMLATSFRLPQQPADNSKEKEITALREVREAAVTSYKKLADELLIMSRFLGSQNNNSHKATGKHLLCAALIDDYTPAHQTTMQTTQEPTTTDLIQQQMTPPRGQLYQFNSMSPAEATLQKYKATPSGTHGTRNAPPCRRGADGQLYPYHPDNPNYTSRFPLGFRGCLSCGQSDHWKRDKCPLPATQAVKEAFLRELWCHKPHTKRSFHPQSPKGGMNVVQGDVHNPGLPPAPYSGPPRSPHIAFHHNASKPDGTERNQRNIDNTPAWLRQEQSEQSDNDSGHLASILRNKSKQNDHSITPDAQAKRGRLFVYFAHICVSKAALPPLRQMPLDLDNDLPGIVMRVGSANKADISFLCHLDTCAAMNTGNLIMHQYVMTEHPELVVSYARYDDREPFMPISLQCAISDETMTETDNTDHNKLVAVVTYRTPYTDNSGKPVTLSFGLGLNVAVRTIIGLPTIKQWQGIIDFVGNTFTSHALKTQFDLLFEETQQGLPEGIEFKPEDFRRPQEGQSGNLMKIAAHSWDQTLLQSALTDGCDEIVEEEPGNNGDE